MKLDSLLSTILNNLSTFPKNEQVVHGSLSVVDFLGQGGSISNGQILQISFDNTNLMLSISSSEGLKISVPSSSLSIEKFFPQTNDPMSIEVKVSSIQNNTANFHVLNINQQPAEQYIKEQINSSLPDKTINTAIIKDTTGVSNVPLKKISVDTIISLPSDIQSLPEQAKLELQNSLQQIKFKVALDSLSANPKEYNLNETQQNLSLNNQLLLQKQSDIRDIIHVAIKDIVAQPQNTTEIIDKAVQNVKNSLQEFIGIIIPAKSATTSVGETIFKSVLGNIKPELALQLPQDLEANIKIIDIIKDTNILKVKVDTSQEKILQILEPLKTQNPQLYDMIISKLPASNDNMLSNISAFTKASTQGDIKHWLGKEMVQELENSGTHGKAIISDLQSALQGSSRNTPLWRIIEIPFYIENHIDKIKLAIKQYPEENEKNPENKDKFGTRFVVDTEFTQLGAFQFDGFSFAKDRRFDLIIRTQRDIDNDLYANIIKIFKTTLHDVQYVGNITINLKENFIKISEDNTDDKFITQDLFV